MRWFKHFNDSLDDPFIQELMDEFGPAGYVAWFGLLEVTAKENGNNLTGKLEINPTYLKRKLRISKGKLQQIFDFCSGKGKLLFDNSLEKWSFEISKMLELKDNYTKDLQGSSKKPSNQTEAEAEAEEDKLPYVETSDEFQLAKLLCDLVLKESPNNYQAKNAEAGKYQSWAKHVDRMIRIDGRTPEQIKYIIQWSQKDAFWMGNILSTAKLREKFDTLVLRVKEMKQKKEENGKSPTLTAIPGAIRV